MSSRVEVMPGGRTFIAVDAPVRRLIATAYDVEDTQVLGGPDWINSMGFDIDAKNEIPSSYEQMHLMLRALLSERFRLKLRRELKDIPVEALSVSKHKLNLQPAVDVDSEPRIVISARTQRGVTVEGQNVKLLFLAKYLSARLRRVVVDRTDLPGSFDFSVEVQIDPAESQDPNIPERDIVVNAFADLVHNLGLKLTTQKASVDFFAVEHLEFPTGN